MDSTFSETFITCVSLLSIVATGSGLPSDILVLPGTGVTVERTLVGATGVTSAVEVGAGV